jgi:transcriptional regulator with XRE-family HTH domain
METKHYIREWRKFRGLTMERLSEMTGLSKPVLSRIERGDQRYNQQVVEELAAALACTPGDLIMRDPTTPTVSFEGLDSSQLQAVRAIADAFRYQRGPKTLPYDMGAEEALIGALLYQAEPAIARTLWAMLPDDAFASKRLGLIYTVMAHMAEGGAMLDPVAVASRLKDEPTFQEAGGVRYLADLIERAPTAGHLPALAGRVFELWVQRAVSGKQGQ